MYLATFVGWVHAHARLCAGAAWVCAMLLALDGMAQEGASMAGPKTPKDGVYRLNTSTGAPYTTPQGTGFQDQVVREVFARLGLTAKVVPYTASARALINANAGVDQGVAMRIMGLEARYPNLVRVEEVLVKNDFVAYSRDHAFESESWTSLLPYVVSYINGWVIFEKNLPHSQEKHAVKSPEQMFSMLDKGRADVILYERWQGLQHAKETGLSVTVHEPPLATVNMYMYVHKDYAKLAPKLAQALRDMKADGTYDAIYARTLSVLAQD